MAPPPFRLHGPPAYRLAARPRKWAFCFVAPKVQSQAAAREAEFMNQPYGAWDSPISGASVASGLSLRDAQWNRAGDTLVWWENRAKTGVLQAQTGYQAPRDLTDATLNVAGRVGYGGGAFTLGAGHVIFVADGRLHSQALAGGVPPRDHAKIRQLRLAGPLARWRMGRLCTQLRRCRWLGHCRRATAKTSRGSSLTAPISSCSRPGIQPRNTSLSSPGIIRRCPGTAASCA